MAGLRHTTDEQPGISRIRAGRGFTYRWPDRRRLADPRTIDRIRKLAIPPAWTDVWISTHPNGHVQATGRDQRGRKQHRYHPRWTAVRDEAKYTRLLAFGRALPALRRRVAADLAVPGLPHRKVVALVVQLLEKTLIRVGNDEYAKHNGSYGLTTILDRHAAVTGRTVRFRFRGKSGKAHDVAIDDRRLARLVKQCQDLPGSQLFQYLDDDRKVRDLTSTEVNRYLRDAMGQPFTAKDFRTWAGTVLAARALHELAALSDDPPGDPVVHAVERVARMLGNTRTVCRKCYVHPAVIDAYLDGSLARALQVRVRRRLDDRRAPRRIETAVLALLERRLRADARQGPSRRRARQSPRRARAISA
jgi:DNA topoisomerase-1